jgi:hypothetical protein
VEATGLGAIGLSFLVTKVLDLHVNTTGSPTNSETYANHDACKADWSKCTSNAELVHEYKGWMKAQVRCKSEANASAKYGTPKWRSYIEFGEYEIGMDYVTTGVAVLVEPDVQFQNGFGAMVNSKARCTYDLRTDRVTNLTITPR